jgi:molybdopterin/thiamine biosynthesis adenylyltransferase
MCPWGNPLAVSEMSERYLRQMTFPGFGEEAQEKLRRATVGVMGVGGLGSPASYYLAAAGVGKLVLVDYQWPELSNLNRQVLHWEEDLGARSKAESAAWKLRRFNSEIEIVERTVEVTLSNIGEVFGEADVILDCLDGYAPRFVLNAYAVGEGKPFVHAAVEGLRGQLTTVIPGRTPCLRCLLPRVPEERAFFPIIGATAGAFGCLEAAEAIKLITGIGEPLAGRLLLGDLQYNSWDTINLVRADNCIVCGKKSDD